MRKKSLQKVIAMLLGGSIILGTTACGSSAKPSTESAEANSNVSETTGEIVAEDGAEVEIVYWEGSTSDKDAFDEALANLEKDHPEIKIVPQVYPSGDYVTMLDTRIAGNDWPDVMRYNYTKIGKYKDQGVMMDLNPYVSEEEREDFIPAFLSACSYDDQLLALPLHTDTIGLYYNKQMFEECNIRIPTSPEDGYTWEELKDIAKTVKEKYDLPFGCAGVWENRWGSRYLPFLYMNGGAMFNDTQDAITMDDPKVLEAIKYYEDLREDNLIANTGFTGPMNTSVQLFVAGQIGFVFAGSWQCSYMQENMGEGKWGVTYMPVKDGKTSSDLGGTSLFGYAGTKYPNAVAIVIKYLTEAQNMKNFCETGSFIPVRKSLTDDGIIYKNFSDEMKVFNDIAATIDEKQAADMTSVLFQQMNEIFCDAMDPMIVDGSATAEDVVEICQDQMSQILSDY